MSPRVAKGATPFLLAVFALLIFQFGCAGGGSAPPPPPPAQNPVPSIASLSPSTTTAGAQQQTVTVQGTNFLSSSTVTYNGQTHAATFVSSTQLTVSLSASDQATGGNYPVVVTNPPPGGGASNSVNFTVNNPQPALTSVAPSVLTAGSPDTPISVVGANFVPQSTVNLNGATLPTTFVSSTQLGATVPASSLAASGTDQITVSSPTPGGGISAALNLIVTKPRPAGVFGPAILSVPPAAALVGKPTQYQVLASSANPSSLGFSLSAAPAGMTISATSGLLQWTPGPNQAGDQQITIVAQDSAGQTSQSFTLSVFGSRAVASATISAATGGTVTVNEQTSPINGLSISIPAGAFAADTTITVSELISPATLGGTPRFLLKGFSVDPDGTQLAVPAQITIPYSTTEFSTTQGIPLEDFLGVYSLQSPIGTLEVLTSFAVDKVSHIVTGTVPHFSVYFVSSIVRLCPPPTNQSECPNVPPTTWRQLPAVLVHGFQLSFLSPLILTHKGAMGDESTWGDQGPNGPHGLRYMLGGLEPGNSGPQIDAWRFDWDSNFTPFTVSAANLDFALCYIELNGVTGQQCPTPSRPLVNLVAHSFGGILVRTYLEGLANPSDPAKASNFPYRSDINRVMTIGTPHSGISITGNHSTFLTDPCVVRTCVDANAYGTLMKTLNGKPLPPLNPSLSPQYDFIAGRARFRFSSGALAYQVDDGLITTIGNQLCGKLPGGGPGFPDVCSQVEVAEEINPETITVPNGGGLCHTASLFNPPNPFGTCQAGFNIAMAAVQDQSHPLWNKICNFLGGCGAAPPAITISVSPSSVTLAPGGTQQFSAQVSGTTNTGVTWTTSGNCGIVSANGLFTAGNVTATCQGTVTATSQADPTRSDSASVTVNTAAVSPTITTQPANQTVIAGQTATFTVVATGTAPLSYQWQKNGADVAGATSASYTTPPTTTADTGSSFDVVVSNIVSSVTSTPATLTVTPPPPPGQVQCAYVANQLSSNVSAYTVDRVTGKLGAVAGSPFAVVVLPSSVAADSAGRSLYVANSALTNSRWVSAFAIGSTCALTELPGSPFPPISLSFDTLTPTALAVHPSGNFVYMSSLAGGVRCFNTDSGFSTCNSPLPPGGPFMNSIALHPTGSFAYVTDQSLSSVFGYSIDLSSGGVTPVPGSPFEDACHSPGACLLRAIALDPLGKFAYVANSDASICVYTIDATSGMLSPRLPCFVEPNSDVADLTSLAVHPSGNFVLASATAGTGGGFAAVYRVDRSTGDLSVISGSPSVAGSGPTSITVDASGQFVYVSNLNPTPPGTAPGSISCHAMDASTGILTPFDCGVSQTGALPSSIVVTAVIPTP